MKTTVIKAVFTGVFGTVLMISCVKEEQYSTPKLSDCTETTWIKNREVSEINATPTVTQHQNSVAGVSDIIEAYVTSSDIGGNFFKSISLQTLDGSSAFSIPVDATSLFINYEPGRKMLIKMDDLYTDVKYGGMRIGGLTPTSSGGAEVGRLSQSDFNKSVNHSCVLVSEDELVQRVTISQVKNDFYINKLIELDTVELDANATISTYYNPNNDVGGGTNYNLMDLQGNTIIFRTSAYANFAAKTVASGSGKIRGVLTKYNSDYQFMVRSEKDISLTQERFAPLLNESFSTGIGAWKSISVTGNESWAYSASYGNPGGCVKISGFSSVNHANEDWLVSPAQNLASLSPASLSFDTAYKFAGTAIQVLISNNYSGVDNPNLATWTVLNPVLSTGNYVWTNSGDLDITSFTGGSNTRVYIAFKYVSTTSAAATWEIDNVKITGN